VRTQLAPYLAAVLVAATTCQPVLATGADAGAAEAARVAQAPLPAEGAAAAAAEEIPAPLAADTEARRGLTAERLVELGRSPDQARQAAGLLTAQDLEVLAANPAMMQAAGKMSQAMFSALMATLIAAGLIAIAASSNGSFIIIST
jgi:hypothetical protein